MFVEFTKFYYQALPPEKQRIYKELYEGFKARQKSIVVHADKRKISAAEINEIATSVYNDTPSFYYLDVSMYGCVPSSVGYTYVVNYVYTSKEVEEYDRWVEGGLKIFCKKYISPAMSEYEKEKVIHDYLVRTVTYDHEALKTNKNIGDAFNILGPLLKKKAVCWGIACAFKLLCDYCKIKSFVVLGDDNGDSSDGTHAWNMVMIDGKTYHVDVTWDIKDKGDISFCYDYFNLDDHLILMDHTWEVDIYPKCDSIEHNYYYKNNLYVKTLNELTGFVSEKLRKKEKYIAVKFASKNLPTKATIEKAVEMGFLHSRKFVPYYIAISEKTHNIYIEVT